MNASQYKDDIERAAAAIRNHLTITPRWSVVLGSGLGGLADRLSGPVTEFAFSDIPGFPTPGVKGHSGKLVAGQFGDIGVLIWEGRIHMYEGHSPWKVAMPTRVSIALGADHFFLTNAAGGIRKDLLPGDLMLITDHLNLMGTNPLVGPNFDDWGPRFPALTHAYDPGMSRRIRELADQLQIPLKQGVYAAMLGPCYETQAEIRMLAAMGADAVGMSTVPEIITLTHAGCRGIAVSLVTNATQGDAPPTHQEVVDMANARRKHLHSLIENLILDWKGNMS